MAGVAALKAPLHRLRPRHARTPARVAPRALLHLLPPLRGQLPLWPRLVRSGARSGGPHPWSWRAVGAGRAVLRRRAAPRRPAGRSGPRHRAPPSALALGLTGDRLVLLGLAWTRRDRA